MFGLSTGYGAGRGGGKRYNAIDVSSRIEGATPHGLVTILYDELLAALDTLVALGAHGDAARRNERHARAVAILHGLDGSLDFEKGGDIARSFSQIYAEGRRLLAKAQREGDMAPITQAKAMIADIAEAWKRIG
ncbi:flagellar protein FliS [Sphingomonas naphthae]|uniref:Flagellar protein FliS n=1 Tax=Sphingomonas naphthae TaxID=1813468 RepID=A0ABY7TIQ3_9SPHN|nr:flagellar protein FliS [Sphingomonas naphthae]WCT72913.1 flagellar protein FliS [Sphingomonas naphthae]